MILGLQKDGMSTLYDKLETTPGLIFGGVNYQPGQKRDVPTL